MDSPLPLWQEGVLDIHAISTGRGECFFYIFPDGTTMMVDAGDLYNYPGKKTFTSAKPSASAIPWQTQAAYVKYFMPAGHSALDYFQASHYHIDHIGYFGGGRPSHQQGDYYLAGVTGLYERVKINKIIDQSYPDYTVDESNTESASYNFKKFVEYNTANNGLQIERFTVGSSSQIVQLYDASSYPGFQVFGVAGNGLAWNGSTVVNTGIDKENAKSCAFLLKYGKFDFFTSGDMNDQTICSTVANGIGRNIEATKAHHHMYNEASYGIESEVYEPMVVVTQSFYENTEQPNQNIINSYASTQDMFFTGIPASLVSQSPEVYGLCKNTEGHVVIRVWPGGDQFYVYVLDDTDYAYRVNAIHGPYQCN